MPTIQPTDRPLFWGVEQGGKVNLTGVTGIGAVTQTNRVSYYAADENTFLGLVSGKAGTFIPLPAFGELCEAGKIYALGADFVICRQTHNRTADVPSTVPALFSVYRSAQTGPMDWIANEPVLVGTLRMYNARQYKCLQAHTTQADWTPPAVPALWQDVTPITPGAWAAGVAYKVNDLVTYTPDGFTYKCLQAHTSQAAWNPPAVPALWQKQ